MFNLICLITIFFSNTSVANVTLPEAWDQVSEPTNFRGELNYKLSELPTSGTIRDQKHLWSGSYWPNYQDSIAARYLSPTEDTLKAEMAAKIIKSYSPAEKLDLLNSDYAFPITASIKERFKDHSVKWAGICNGWAAASILFSEPKEVTMTNKENIVIVFYPSDIKALLSYYYFDSKVTKFIGSRCKSDIPDHLNVGEVTNKPCDDTNAGSFHLALTNLIGKTKQGFVADVKRGKEVWNHPVVEYSSVIKGEYAYSYPRANPNAVEHLLVETKVTYVSENSPTIQTSLGTTFQNEFTKTYQYIIELDQSKKIIGGEWVSWERPDFLWTPEKMDFPEELKQLKKLVLLSGAEVI